MKRSRINEIIREADTFIRSFGYVLPPFARWTPEEMKARRAEISPIVERHMGWDITDYGQGRFDEIGLFLFTVRNGIADDLRRGRGMLYAEKIMISRRDQLSPMHRHYTKAEDIINRGGGRLVLELFMPDADGRIDPETEVSVPVAGLIRRLPAGGHLALEPGAAARRLARLLGRGRRRADRRGLDRQRRSVGQLVPRSDRAVFGGRGRRAAVPSARFGL